MKLISGDNKKLLTVSDAVIARIVQHEYDHLNGIICVKKGR